MFFPSSLTSTERDFLSINVPLIIRSTVWSFLFFPLKIPSISPVILIPLSPDSNFPLIFPFSIFPSIVLFLISPLIFPSIRVSRFPPVILTLVSPSNSPLKFACSFGSEALNFPSPCANPNTSNHELHVRLPFKEKANIAVSK
ncbi:hypothetical protein C1645_29793 [Glomus cerebriforme]|uniref:Uncharacterized protein n=1 Tax=Glomus cerebriforme TaxID=658196 RepID=A0A397T4B4_9GLOM|nr:hypothetical protein C1645_29793 [Glomus cerebriforme]